MDWSYFTDYLDGTRSITEDERNELYDNLQTVLTTSGCTEAGYSLNSDDLAAVKASGMWTDIMGLDGPGASYTADRLEAVIAAAASAFANYEDAVAGALDGEDITADERDELLASGIECTKLWNYYKRLIDGLSCEFECPEPTVEVQVRGASSYRYGFTGFSGTPKKYRTVVSRGWGTFIGPLYVLNAAQCSYLPLATGLTGAASSITYSSLDPDTEIDSADDCSDGIASLADAVSASVASDNRVSVDTPPRAPAGTEALLDEITLSAFLAEVVAAARAADFADGTSLNRVSYYTQYDPPTNPTRLDVQTARIRFRFPSVGRYRVSWSVIWTPRSWGGSTWSDGTPEVYETASWVWDRVTPDDYDPDDQSTWPVSPWFELPEATMDGRYTVADIVADCTAPSSVSEPGAVGGYGT